MRIDWAVACRYAEVGADGTAVIVGAGMDRFFAEALPARIKFWTVLRLMARSHERGQQHELSMRLLGPDLDEIEELTATLETAWPLLEVAPGWEEGNVVAMTNRFVADEPGAYSFEISLDERHAMTVGVLVSAAPPI